jgi:hypothetical protein
MPMRWASRQRVVFAAGDEVFFLAPQGLAAYSALGFSVLVS